MAVAPNPPDPGSPALSAAAPLDADRLRAGLAAAGVPWRDVTVVDTTGSTNADLVAALQAGRSAAGSVIAAAEQTAGRGRMGRAWASPPGTTVSVSVALAAPPQQAGFLPLLTGLAVTQAVAAAGAGGAAALKWPNDVLVGGRKVAGILAEAAHSAVVVGCGINVSMGESDLPVPEATSLLLAGVVVDRTDMLIVVLTRLHREYERWSEAGFDATASGLLARYRAACATLGRDVTVHLPDGREVAGRANDVDAAGRLVLAAIGGSRVLTAGDVVHLR